MIGNEFKEANQRMSTRHCLFAMILGAVVNQLISMYIKIIDVVIDLQWKVLFSF